VIGCSPPLAYSSIFIVMSSKVVDIYLHMHSFIPVTVCTCTHRRPCNVPRHVMARYQSSFYYYYYRLHAVATVTHCRSNFRVCVDRVSPVCYHMTNSCDHHCVQTGGTISHTFRQTLMAKDRQCCESWRNDKLGVHAVCAVGDMTDATVDLLCCSPHRDTAMICLMNDTLTIFSSSSDCYDV